MYCPRCGTQVPDNAMYCTSCGAMLSAAPTSAAAPAIGMKWHKFQIYFALFASAVLNLISAAQFITGLQYGPAADEVYAMYGVLKILDVGYGVILLAVVAFTIVTRFYLARFKASGPVMLMMIYVLVIAFSLIYLIAAAAAIDVSVGQIMPSSFASNTASSLVMMGVNWAYYKKRKHLFVN